jgi:hypothetical protein
MWPNGYRGWVTGPQSYTMTYLNGQRSYTEPFACILIPPPVVQQVEGAINAAVTEVCADLASFDPGGIPVGPALGAVIELGTQWYEHASQNPDGSITLCFADHFAGTQAGGIDLTAWPLPGVDGGAWAGAVSGLMRAIQTANSVLMRAQGMENLAPRLELQPAQTPGSPRK